MKTKYKKNTWIFNQMFQVFWDHIEFKTSKNKKKQKHDNLQYLT